MGLQIPMTEARAREILNAARAIGISIPAACKWGEIVPWFSTQKIDQKAACFGTFSADELEALGLVDEE